MGNNVKAYFKSLKRALPRNEIAQMSHFQGLPINRSISDLSVRAQITSNMPKLTSFMEKNG